MKFLKYIILLLIMPFSLLAQDKKITNQQYREDFNFFWQSINDEYCYFNKKQTDWEKVKEIYSPLIDTVSSRNAFVGILEKTLYEIYDHHAILNTNTDQSFRLVPSGTDTWAEYIAGKPTIVELRKAYGSERAGIIPGMEIIAINDIPVEKVVVSLLPKSLKSVDTESKNFALRVALAGNHVADRKFTLRYHGKTSDYYPDKNGKQLEHINHPALIESRLLGHTGYIKINDCLYDDALIPAFDSVMALMQTTSSLIIDLRETPSGGNTTVGKAILGWFINQEHFYQKHEYYADEKNTGIKRSWEEIVSPRKDKYYNKPLVVLCDHWTASLGEAIIIGFATLKRPNTAIIGTELARLNGAVYSYEMPNSKIHFTSPAERLYTINGLPREKYEPEIIIGQAALALQQSGDVFISRALDFLRGVTP